MNSEIPPDQEPRDGSFWPSLAAALALGGATAAVALGLLGYLSPASKALPAALQAVKAIASGESASMKLAFASEVRLDLASGDYELGPRGVRLGLLYAQEGSVASFARLPSNASLPCELALEIDGLGNPALASDAFTSFTGLIQGAPPGLSPPRAAGAAFTVAHELAHCELWAQPWTLAATAIADQARKQGVELGTQDRSDLSAFLSTPFGRGLIHEGYADAKASQSLWHRTSKEDFKSLMDKLLSYRRLTTLGFERRSAIAQDNAHHTQYALSFLLGAGNSVLSARKEASRQLALDSAAQGALAFFWIHPEAGPQAHLPPSLASKLAQAGASLCSRIPKGAPSPIDCARI